MSPATRPGLSATRQLLFRCPECDYVCNKKGNLKRHFRSVHEERKESFCCGKLFTTTAAIRLHQKTVHGNGYCCPTCSMIFDRKVSLWRHRFTHTAEKPLQCACCSYKTCSKYNLQRHVRLRHSTVRKPKASGRSQQPQASVSTSQPERHDLAPQLEPHAPAPQPEPHAPAPQPEPHAPAPQPKAHAPAPQLESHASVPQQEPHAPAPRPEAHAPAPLPETHAYEPQPEPHAPAPQPELRKEMPAAHDVPHQPVPLHHTQWFPAQQPGLNYHRTEETHHSLEQVSQWPTPPAEDPEDQPLLWHQEVPLDLTFRKYTQGDINAAQRPFPGSYYQWLPETQAQPASHGWMAYPWPPPLYHQALFPAAGSHWHSHAVPHYTQHLPNYTHATVATHHSHAATAAHLSHAATAAHHSHAAIPAHHRHAATVAHHSHAATVAHHSHAATVTHHSHTAAAAARHSRYSGSESGAQEWHLLHEGALQEERLVHSHSGAVLQSRPSPVGENQAQYPPSSPASLEQSGGESPKHQGATYADMDPSPSGFQEKDPVPPQQSPPQPGAGAHHHPQVAVSLWQGWA
ncbi:leucine-rich repeat extensin-like protein 3 [Portunus trituberculatus]|uniref:leucine-rich repeat extensin-like protein 3 n=1 Tax=Portunus trituberculatus TaxID=210409 RepID=UPI001E1CD567|nr:leucine-rich repeat extensin-like protein 3 [Portunus trituberculatus]